MVHETPPPNRKIEKWFMLASAAAFFYFGFGFLLFPTSFCATLDIQLNSPTAITDIRAIYGGFEIGVGIFICFCTRNPLFHRPGLLAVACTVGGFGAGRLFGIVVDGSTVPLMVGFAILEITVTIIALFLFFRLKDTKDTTR